MHRLIHAFSRLGLGVLIAQFPWAIRVYAADPIPPGLLPEFNYGEWTSDPDQLAPILDLENNILTIEQAKEKAIFNWESFNIGKDARVEFVQLSADSVALNKILSQSPSYIFGQLKANGSVYLINPNSIVFGEGAQVDVGGLIASTLELSDEKKYFEDGSFAQAILNSEAAFERSRPDDEETAEWNGKIIIEDGAEIKAKPRGSIFLFGTDVENSGKIEVEDGQIILAASKDKIYLVASDRDPRLRGFLVEVKDGGTVHNDATGDILARRGNATLLGMAVNQEGRVSATTSVNFNGSVRLLARQVPDLEEPQVPVFGALDDEAASAITGSGLGDITFLGPLTGENTQPSAEIIPLARETGRVTLTGPDSITEVIPEVSDEAVTDASVQLPSTVEMVGKEIEIYEGAEVVARGGEVYALAAARLNARLLSSDSGDASIIIDNSAKIDVSGMSAELPVESRILEVDLRGTELADSPVQKNGPLRGQKILVDIKKGTPLANIEASKKLITETINERLGEGGEINLISTGSVYVGESAELNMSGGWVAYDEGYLTTSKLIYNNQIIDIGSADPNLRYQGLLGQWMNPSVTGGESKISPILQSLASFEAAYVEGKDAGRLSILGQTTFLNGSLRNETVSGIYQREIDNQVNGGTLNIIHDFYINGAAQNIAVVNENEYLQYLENFSENEDGELEINTATPLIFSDGFFKNRNITEFNLRAKGQFSLHEESVLSLTPASRFSVTARDASEDNGIVLLGDIVAPAGDIDVETLSPRIASENVPQNILIGENVAIELSGNVVNDTVFGPTSFDSEQKIFSDGGSFSASANGSLMVSDGVSINLNGGAYIDRQGKLIAGSGGDLSLLVKTDPQFESNDASSQLLISDDASISSFSADIGGTLSLRGPQFKISEEPMGEVTSWLNKNYFEDFGFSAVSVVAYANGIDLVEGTRIEGIQKNYIFRPGIKLPNLEFLPSGADLESYFDIGLKEPHELNGVDISLTSTLFSSDPRLAQAPLRFHKGAELVLGPNAQLTLQAEDSLWIDGKIIVPGGHVKLIQGFSLADERAQMERFRQSSLVLGANSLIDVSGKLEKLPNKVPGVQDFRVIDAGKVFIDGVDGFVFQEFGSLVKANGSVAQARIPLPGSSQLSELRDVTVVAKPGEIELEAGESIILDGFFVAESPIDKLAGGEFSVTLDPNKVNKYARDSSNSQFLNLLPLASPKIVLTQDYSLQIPSNLIERDRDTGGIIAVEQPWQKIAAESGSGMLQNNGVVLSADKIAEGGFGTLALNIDHVLDVNQVQASKTNTVLQVAQESLYGAIEFVGSVALELGERLNINATQLVMADVEGGNSVELSAPYIELGKISDSNQFLSAIYDFEAPEYGENLLTLNGSLIDLRGVTSVSQTDLVVIRGTEAIRGRGYRGNQSSAGDSLPEQLPREGRFITPNNVLLSSPKISPATLNSFAFESMEGTGGTISTSVLPGSETETFSVGGAIRLLADNIAHGGNIVAPNGKIELLAADKLIVSAGGVLSVEMGDTPIPFGRTEALGRFWQYDFSEGSADKIIYSNNPDISQGQYIFPEKEIVLNASELLVNEGASIALDGGGDVLASEFIPGPGGSKDVLSQNNSGESFVILPSYQNGFAPIDGMDKLSSAYKAGQTLIISNSKVVPEGEYILLPARYAIVPGAYLVTPTNGARLGPNQDLQDLDGTPLSVGKLALANTGFEESHWRGFRIEPGGKAFERSEFLITSANEFFNDGAALSSRPNDGGDLNIKVEDRFAVNALIGSTGSNEARGGNFSFSSSQSLVIGPSGATAMSDSVFIEDDFFSTLAFEKVLVGGVFSEIDKNSVKIDNSAERISIMEHSRIEVDELTLVANKEITVGQGAQLYTAGASSEQLNYSVASDVNLLSISNNKQLGFVREGSSATEGLIKVEGAEFATAGTLIFNASGVLNVNENAQLSESIGRLGFGAHALKLETSGLADGVSYLSPNLWAGASVDTLFLNSTEALSLAQSMDSQVSHIDIQSPGIVNVSGQAELVLNANETIRLKGRVFDGNIEAGSESGVLSLSTREIQIGSENSLGTDESFGIAGFEFVSFFAAEQLVTVGDTRLNIDGGSSVSVDTPLLTAQNASHLDVTLDKTAENTSTFSLRNSGGGQAEVSQQSLGGRLTINAGEIEIDSRIGLVSGQLSLQSETAEETDAAAIRISSNAHIDLAARDFNFDTETRSSWGGSFNARARNGGIDLSEGAEVDISGARFGEAGSFILEAKNGTVNITGKIAAQSAVNSGQLSITASEITGIDGLSSLVDGGVFREKFYIRLLSGDLNVLRSEIIRSQHISLLADTGSVNILGELNASGAKAGDIQVFANDDLNLSNETRLLARAEGFTDGTGIRSLEKGGRVTLSSKQGVLDANVAYIDLSSNDTGAPGGKLLVKLGLDQIESSDFTMDLILGDVKPESAGKVVLEANRVIDVNTDADFLGYVDSVYINKKFDELLVDLDNLVLEGVEGWNSHEQLKLIPGVHLLSDADLIFEEPVPTDFFSSQKQGILFNDLRYGNDLDSGVFSATAQGDIHLRTSLLDGFEEKSYTAVTGSAGEYVRNPLFESELLSIEDSCPEFFGCFKFLDIVGGGGWDIHLVAGYDESSASPFTTVSGVGDVIADSGVKIMTGEGDITVQAGNDINFADSSVGIFSYGLYDMPSVIPGDDPAGKWFAEGLPQEVLIRNYFPRPVVYPEYSGNISVVAGNNIEVIDNSDPVYFTRWLPRAGRVSVDTHLPTWAVMPSSFSGVGTGGGADLYIEAGGEIRDLTIANPSTAKQVVTLELKARDAANVTNGDGEIELFSVADPGAVGGGELKYLPGGNFEVIAGGDIKGSQFVLGSGLGNIYSGGSIRNSESVGNVFALGASADLKINAAGDIIVESISDLTASPQSQNQKLGVSDSTSVASIFFNYDENTVSTINALSGNVILSGDSGSLADFYTEMSGDLKNLRKYPSNLNVKAFNGGLQFNNQTVIYPSSVGTVEWLVQDNIEFLEADQAYRVVMSDGEISLLPHLVRNNNGSYEVANFDADYNELSRTGGVIDQIFNLLDAEEQGPAAHAFTLLHGEDEVSNLIIANSGNILGNANTLFLPKQTYMSANKNISNLGLVLQNNRLSDTSAVIAKTGDFRFDFLRQPTGRLISRTVNEKVRFEGPGEFLLMAGTDIDLGASPGVELLGSLRNIALPDNSGNLTIMAGINQTPAYNEFLGNEYYRGLVLEASGLVVDGNAEHPEDIEQLFEALPERVKQTLVRDAILAELRYSGIEALDGLDDELYSGRSAEEIGLSSSGYKRGFEAIATLFPDSENQQGNIDLVASRIFSFEDGGIELFAPYGEINVGAPSEITSTNNSNADATSRVKGIVSLGSGSIEGLANGDMNVNRERIFTLNGGDVMLWSSNGDIDAGKGAATTITVPPPRVIIDSNGVVKVEIPPAIEGSGIAALSLPDTPKDEVGSVFLFAPSGIIDAGDAGIRTSGNAFLGATQVLNAENIEVGGVSLGVPVASGISSALSSASAAASSASESASESVTDSMSDSSEQTAEALLEVEVINESDGCGVSLDDGFCS